MKIKTEQITYEEMLQKPGMVHKNPKKPNLFFRTLMRVVSASDLKATNFSYREYGMEKLGKDEPCLILMNHSSIIDLKIASTVFADRPFNIICTSDGFVGKEWLMRNLGCIPTNKFVTETTLIKDMLYAVRNLKCSVLMYPEASYSFDGTATPLPDSLGKCLKLLKVPVVMVKTYGAFARDPLYNNLQLRDVTVTVDIKYLLSPEEIKNKSVSELNQDLTREFSFDNFRWQQENKVKITEPFRADYLNRVLYKCAGCGTEGKMEGKGIHLTCHACGKQYELTELGALKAVSGETEYAHIPDWFKWQRECVKEEITNGKYGLDLDVDIYVLKNMKCLYQIGEGHLQHGKDGFVLTGCDGKLNYKQKTTASYSLYSDYYWYELGDMICIGDSKQLYYCFPKEAGDVVAKTRIAAEELYKNIFLTVT